MAEKNSFLNTGGDFLSRAIRDNLFLLFGRLRHLGLGKGQVISLAYRREGFLSPGRLQEIEEMARRACVPFEELLTFNLYEDLAFQEGCTVLMALGSASASGAPIFLKNSDKVGGKSLVGPNFHLHKEINVILDARAESGRRILGVAAAGSTGLKMGMNDAGVVTGSNIGRTLELKGRKVDLTTIRALDRGQLMRDGLEFEDAASATDAVLSEIARNPQSTPGNIEFLDRKEAFIIEGSYDRFAVEMVQGNRVVARANHFLLLKDLNDPADIAGHKRYHRAEALLREHYGQIDRQKMLEFSMDHFNGPGPNSICRHGVNPEEETTLSAAVMEVNPERPEKSLITIALGKACRAWQNPEGHVTLSLDCPSSAVPADFLSGEVWKRLYTEEPLAA